MKKLLVLLCIAMLFQSLLRAQAPLIKGRVVDDSTGAPMPDVSLVLSGTSKGTTTGPDGSFTLSFPSDGRRQSLVASYAGYGSVTLPVTEASDKLVIRLKKQAKQLEDVVGT